MSLLTAVQREALAALHLLTEPVRAKALAQIIGVSVPVVRRALADLRELGLAAPEVTAGRAGDGNFWSAT